MLYTIENKEFYMQDWLEETESKNLTQFEMGTIWSKNNNLFKITEDFKSLIYGIEYDAIAGIETKGIIFASALSVSTQKPLVMFRKKNKIAYTDKIIQFEFTNWKGGIDGIEVEKEQLKKYKKILVVDDVTLTHSTFEAVHQIVNRSSCSIASYVCFANLSDTCELNGVKILSLLNHGKQKNDR